ncbi:MAG: hypothetical protein EOO18_11365 [Chryseobacterium sp.]|nr:MAG: hypothetical protein EOO18_11365 [Chryseobacterium sp.]
MKNTNIWDSSEISSLDLDSFNHKFGIVRDQLSYRLMSGEVLQPADKLLLTLLNKRLDELIPESSIIVEESENLIKEIRRLIATDS